MDIILYLLSIIQYLYQQNCWLINLICRYIPLKQWAFDDSHSPKYQKFKVDELPLITDFRQDGASTLARNKNYYKPQKCGLFYVKFYLFLCCTELYFIFICDIMRYETQL